MLIKQFTAGVGDYLIKGGRKRVNTFDINRPSRGEKRSKIAAHLQTKVQKVGELPRKAGKGGKEDKG